MTTKEIKKESFWHFNQESFRKSVDSHCVQGVKQLKKTIHSYIFFHLFFIGLLAAEVTSFFVFLTFLFQTSFIAFFLASILLTGFAYLILLFYFQTKKPGQLVEIRNWFMGLCKKGLPSHLNQNDYHLSLANAAYIFSSLLTKQDSSRSAQLNSSLSLNKLIRKVTKLYFQKDMHKMQEILAFVSINEHIQLIKKTPTNLEAHASLANAYVALSHLYRPTAFQHRIKNSSTKFKAATKKALQEFKIIDYFSPNDPWVYAQLASCYHDLELYDDEANVYEQILKLCPDDKQIMFRLGILCFQQGKSGQGLELYQKLKALNFSRADELIDFYDANIKKEYCIQNL